MALPNNKLSDEVVEDTFIGGRALTVTNGQDYESGGIALSDPTQGLNYQVWSARISEDFKDIVVSADTVSDTVLYSGNDISEVSLSFDQNMRPVLAFVEGGITKLRWFDTTVQQQVVTSYGADHITPRVSLDDKRLTQSSNSDVIFAYLRNGNLYYRQQRDRYLTEYLLAENVGASGIVKFGMGRNWRLHFLMRW